MFIRDLPIFFQSSSNFRNGSAYFFPSFYDRCVFCSFFVPNSLSFVVIDLESKYQEVLSFILITAPLVRKTTYSHTSCLFWVKMKSCKIIQSDAIALGWMFKPECARLEIIHARLLVIELKLSSEWADSAGKSQVLFVLHMLR